MAREYDKFDKDAFCEMYEKASDTGSDGKTIKEKYEPEAKIIFGGWDNFISYFNGKDSDKAKEINENSKLIDIIDSVKTGKVNPRLAKKVINDLKKANFPFDKLDYEANPLASPDIQSQNLFYVARKYAKDNF